MTWRELLRRDPTLRFVRDAVQKQIGELLGMDARPWTDDAEVDPRDLIALLAYRQKQAGAQRDSVAAESWERLPDGTSKGIRLAFFLSNKARVQPVPSDFLRAFLDGGPLDAAFSSCDEPGEITVSREERVMAQLPASLVGHLLQVRSRRSRSSSQDDEAFAHAT